MRVLKGPRVFPVKLPVGPAQEVSFDWVSLQARIEDSTNVQQALDEGFSGLMEGAEKEWAAARPLIFLPSLWISIWVGVGSRSLSSLTFWLKTRPGVRARPAMRD